MSIEPRNVKLAERQHRLPLEIVEAFKAGVEWRDHCRAGHLDDDAKHYAMFGEIRRHQKRALKTLSK